MIGAETNDIRITAARIAGKPLVNASSAIAPTVASAAAAIEALNEPWRSARRVPAGVATMRTSWNAARTTPIAAGSSPRAASQTGKNGKYQPVVPKNAA